MARMSGQIDHLQRIDHLIWAVIVAVAVTVSACSIFGTFQIAWISYAKVAAGCLALCGAGQFYLRVRKDAPPASALICTAQIAAFAAVGAPLSYVAASAGLPLWDTSFVAWDRQLGLDWMAWLKAMNDHPTWHTIFSLAYMSFALQTTAAVFGLAVSGHLLRLRTFIIGFMLASLITIGVSALVPAEGVWGHLHLTAHDYPDIVPATRDLHLHAFHGLRDGTFRQLMAEGAEGIITFPSLHAAIGLLFILAMWPVKYLRWIALLLNVTMIAATPIDGGHYFSDVIAGLVIAALSWRVASRLVATHATIAALPVLTMPDAPSIVPAVATIGAERRPSPATKAPRQDAPTGVI